MLIKNLQIAETVHYEDAAAYTKHVSNFVQWTGTLGIGGAAAEQDGDKLTINSETLTAQLFDYSAKDVVNGMSGFTGEKGLFLLPGANTLKYTDDRTGETNPDTHAGVVEAVISYRERYL
ncbi:hypothetical protein CCP3SC15_4740002 [Gammaproteobacteria bacterium]